MGFGGRVAGDERIYRSHRGGRMLGLVQVPTQEALFLQHWRQVTDPCMREQRVEMEAVISRKGSRRECS